MVDSYILDEHGQPVAEPDLMKWAKWFGTTPRHVAITDIGHWRVSTVFLGIDHNFGNGPPILWETMVFNDEPSPQPRITKVTQGTGRVFLDRWSERQWRYSTREEAERGHKEIVGELEREFRS